MVTRFYEAEIVPGTGIQNGTLKSESGIKVRSRIKTSAFPSMGLLKPP
jgi:hypothetical protein